MAITEPSVLSVYLFEQLTAQVSSLNRTQTVLKLPVTTATVLTLVSQCFTSLLTGGNQKSMSWIKFKQTEQPQCVGVEEHLLKLPAEPVKLNLLYEHYRSFQNESYLKTYLICRSFSSSVTCSSELLTISKCCSLGSLAYAASIQAPVLHACWFRLLYCMHDRREQMLRKWFIKCTGFCSKKLFIPCNRWGERVKKTNMLSHTVR